MSTQQGINKNLTLFALTWPIFIEISLRMLMGNADTFMLSHYSDNAVAAVGVANQLVQVVLVMYGFVGMGTGIVISQFLGAKQREKANEVIVVALGLNLLFGLVLSAGLFAFGVPLLHAMDIPQELIDNALQFLRIVGGLSFLEAVSMTVAVVVRTHGFTKDAMFVTLGMNILNVIGDYLFLYGPFGIPVLGVTGVAMSTTFARLLGLVVMFMILRKRVEGQLPFYKLLKMPREPMAAILKIGVPAAGEVLSYNASQIVITYFIAKLGAEALTTKVYAQNIMSFIYLFSLSVAQATQILVGHLIGDGQREKAYRTCLRSLKMGIIASLCMAGLFSIFRVHLLSFFTDNHSIIAMGSTLILITMIMEPGRTFNLVIISSLRATGDVKFPVYMGILSMWGIAVSLAYLLGIHFGLGLIGVWIAFTTDEWFRGLFMLWRWRSRKWERMSFVRKQQQTEELAG
ncbi:MAG: MATE family efflux transporter [Tumebacillaceae bacterium]